MCKDKKPWALEKHQLALEGTGFEECADCPGTSGKVEEGKMNCSRAGAVPVAVTLEQAKACDGTNPVEVAQKNAHQVHYLIPKPARKSTEYRAVASA